MSLKDVSWGPLLTLPTHSVPTVLQDTFLTQSRCTQALSRLESDHVQRAEAWRYSSLKSLAGYELSSPTLFAFDQRWLVKRNGQIIEVGSTATEHEQVRLMTVSSLASQVQQQQCTELEQKVWSWLTKQMSQDEAIHDLQSLHFQEGLVVIVPKSIQAGQLELSLKKQQTNAQHSSNQLLLNSSNLWIYLDEGSSLELIETFDSSQETTQALLALTAIYQAAESKLTYTRSQTQARGQQALNTHLGRVVASVYRQAKLNLMSLNLGADLCRIELDISLEEHGAFADLSGLYLGSDQAQLDQHLTLRHKVASCRSSQRFKGALGAQSRGIFTGRVIVSSGASDTQAEQNNPNLLLSETAKAVTRPQLEIYNDDVECSHGATVGQLDEDALFYLRARGLDESAALRVLTSAFVGEIREALPNFELKEAVDQSLKLSLGLEQDHQHSEEWIDWDKLDQ